MASESPLASVGGGGESSPELADLDGDGDLDAAVGGAPGQIAYFENVGAPAAAVFERRIGAADPFDGIVGSFNPDLADLDGDGDLDALVGDSDGTLHYFENTGTPTAPALVEQTGSANPFDGLGVGDLFFAELTDLDRDGDLDAVVGTWDGALKYFENIGTPAAPAFVERTGGANPVGGIHVGDMNHPELADLDGDGDLDVLLGEDGGRVVLYRSSFMVFTDGFESGGLLAWSASVP
jgi:hypothetical protein